jgi:hypothetical protein
MMRAAAFPRLFGLSVAFVAAAAVGCGDGLSPSLSAAGHYRLVSVNGQPLPFFPPSLGLTVIIQRGDLLLRPNGSFRHGLAGNLIPGQVLDGTYRQSGREVMLRGAVPNDDLVARVSGDSITLAYPTFTGNSVTLVYQRVPLEPSVVPADDYRLRSINGRTAEPLVVYDTTMGDHRHVATVVFDSLLFSDGMFFRRRRSESAIGYTNGQVTSASASEWTTWGTYESRPSAVVLLHYSVPPASGVPARDSLSIAGDTLVRRVQFILGPREERYTRQ